MSESLTLNVVQRAIKLALRPTPIGGPAAAVVASVLGDAIVKGLGRHSDGTLSQVLPMVFGLRDDDSDESKIAQIAELIVDSLPPISRSLDAIATSLKSTPPHNQNTLQKVGSLRRWDLNYVMKSITDWWKESRKVGANDPERTIRYPHRIELEEALLSELSGRHSLPVRYAYAEMVADSFRRIGAAPSDFRTGREVHQELQQRYLKARGSNNTIVQEADVYFRGEWPRKRNIRKLTKERYRECLKRPNRLCDMVWAAIEGARTPEWSSGRLRWDVGDLTLAQTWEIKAVFTLRDAVLQEAYYRNKFGRNAAKWLDPADPPRHTVSVPLLRMGVGYPLVDSRGIREIFTKNGRVALPFEILELPGVVAYRVLRRRVRKDEFKDAIRQILRREATDLAELADKILDAMTPLLIVVLFAVIIIFAVLVWILIKILEALGREDKAPPDNVVPFPRPKPKDPVQDPIRRPAAVRLLPGSGVLVDIEPREASTPLMSLRFGHILVSGIPASEVGLLVETIGTVLSDTFEAIESQGSAVTGTS